MLENKNLFLRSVVGSTGDSESSRLGPSPSGGKLFGL